jgi:molybdenum cofactor synthesis domain-containing protein
MRPELFSHVVSFQAALARVMSAAVPIDRTEHVPLTHLIGRVAAEPVLAPFDIPPFHRAAMDGYALRSTDVVSAGPGRPVRLAWHGRTLAGDGPAIALVPGTAVEIATGAPIPAGADAVVMVERTAREGDVVLVHEPAVPGQNIGRRGADMAAGATVIEPGDWITPARAGCLAAMGQKSLTVYAKPTVAVFATGHEIAPLDRTLSATEIYDVNTTTISAIVSMHGGVAEALPPVGDSVEALRAAFARAGDSDVVVCSGGSSVGSRDLVTDVIGSSGEIWIHGIAIKPGKPTLVGRWGKAVVFGMPGNPTSCLSNAYLLLAPYLRAVARLPVWTPAKVEVPLAAEVRSTAGRHHFYSVKIVDGRAVPAFKSSGDITSLAGADGYLEIPPDIPALEAGQLVTVTLF